jgi:hypothetical protein
MNSFVSSFALKCREFSLYLPGTELNNTIVNCGEKFITIVMSEQFAAWIRRVAILSDPAARQLPRSGNTSYAFRKGALSPYRENQPESSESPARSYSLEGDTQDCAEYESEIHTFQISPPNRCPLIIPVIPQFSMYR